MRTERENQRIESLAHALMRRRGIEPTAANYEQVSDAYAIAAEAVEGGKATVAEMLAVGAVSGGVAADESVTRLLAKFATDGRFVAEGGAELAETLETDGYDAYLPEGIPGNA